MKNKTFVFLSLVVIFSTLLAACAPSAMPVPEVIHQPDGSGQVVTSPYGDTSDQAYIKCEASKNGELATGIFKGQDVTFQLCQALKSDMGWIVPMSVALKYFPGWEDDAAFAAGVFTYEGVKFLLIAGSTAAAIVLPSQLISQGIVQTQVVSVVWTMEGTLPTVNLTAGFPAIALPRGPHHEEHDIVNKLENTAEFIAGYNAWVAAGGPNNDPGKFRCIVLMIGDQAARYIVWSKKGRNILVWDALLPDGETSLWVTNYGPKGGGSLLNVPGDVQEKYPNASMAEAAGCNNFPNFPALPTSG